MYNRLEKNTPLVSVLIITYNRAEYLDDCLYSILLQDYSNYEVVIKDDCSTDNTYEVIEKYKILFEQKNKKFIYVKNKKNLGINENFFQGLDICSSDYIMPIADDDFYVKDNAISSCVKAMQLSEGINYVIAKNHRFDVSIDQRKAKDIVNEAKTKKEDINFQIIDGNIYFKNFWSKYGPDQVQAGMFDKKLLFERGFRNMGCLDQSIPLLLSLNKKVAVSDNTITFYRVHNVPQKNTPNSMKTKKPDFAFESHKDIWRWSNAAKKYAKINIFSLFVWRVKTAILKESGPMRYMHIQSNGLLNSFFEKVKNHSCLHYFVLRYLSVYMLDFDSKRLFKTVPGALFFKFVLTFRKFLSNLIIKIDRFLHDPGFDKLAWVKSILKRIAEKIKNLEPEEKRKAKQREQELKRYNQALSLQKSGDKEEAEKLLEKCIETFKEYDLLSSVYLNLGKIYHEKGKIIKAKRMLNKGKQVIAEYKNITAKASKQ